MVSILVDAGDWVRQRQRCRTIGKAIQKASNLGPSHVDFTPIYLPGQLIHPKAIALLGERPKSTSSRRGCLILTSANTTSRGAGLVQSNPNVEIALVTAEETALDGFESLFDELRTHAIDKVRESQQDEFLRWLELLAEGCFYHKWSGDLGAEVRWRLKLTKAGIEAYKTRRSTFSNYAPSRNSISRDPFDLRQLFKAHRKPFPASFWKTYAMNTLYGFWVPEPINTVVEDVLAANIRPLVKIVRRRLESKSLEHVCTQLRREVEVYHRKGWIRENTAAVDSWKEKIQQFRENDELMALRLRPYQAVPDILDADAHRRVRALKRAIEERLEARKVHRGVRRVLADFVAESIHHKAARKQFQILAAKARDEIES